LKIYPIEEFFTTIKRLSKQSDYEMRRRVAEALPALYQIDLENGKELFKIIRMDWDDNWKSDNRRRAIESLCYLIENDKKFVKNNRNYSALLKFRPTHLVSPVPKLKYPLIHYPKMKKVNTLSRLREVENG